MGERREHPLVDVKLPNFSRLGNQKNAPLHIFPIFLAVFSCYLTLCAIKKCILLREIGRVVDVARLYKAIGDAWYTYANTPEGKAHLAESGHSIADIMREAGFKVGSLVAQAKATAQQQIQTIEASNWQPAIEEELDALLEDIEAEEQLSEINQQEANQPTTIPAEESITGQEITIEPEPRSFGEASLGVERPETGSDEAGTTPEPPPAALLLSLIASGKAKTQDFARFFRDTPSITEAQATELGIRPLTQRGNPTATYTQGRLIAANLTPRQFEDYLNGKLKGKALKQALTPQPAAPTNFSIKAVQEMQNVHNCVQELSSGEDGTLRNTAWGHDIIVPHGRIGKKGYWSEPHARKTPFAWIYRR